ncbi:MAG: hypothetical protein EAZ40_18615, partial [Rhodobacterales bacterium]
MSPALKGAVCGLLGFGLFALADATIKFLGGTYSPVQIVAFAGLFTLPLIGLLWLSAPVSLRPVYPGLMAVRTLALIGNGLLVTYAFTVMPLAQAYAIFFTLPLILTLLAWPLLGDRVDAIGALAIVIGLVGVLVALNPGRVTFDIGHVAAVGGVVLAAATSTIFSLVGAEIATIAAAESEEPSKVISRMTVSVTLRILIFYILSIFLIVAVVPWTEIVPK